MKKFMLRVVPVIVMLVLVVVPSVFALDVDQTFNNSKGGNASGTAAKAINGVWSTVLLVLQIAAVAAIVFAGVKYMFAGADEKASIKSGLLVLAVGAILVFGASTVVRLLINTLNDVA